MASFSFNCPQCGKVYKNVKSKMAGRKVRCNCGKIFRLGPKTEKQIADSADRKAKRRAGRNEAEIQPETPDRDSNSPSLPNIHSSPPVPVVGQPSDNVEEILEAIPVDETINPKIFEDDRLLDLETGEAYVDPMSQEAIDLSAVQKEAWALSTPRPFRKKPTEPNEKHVKLRKPMGGAIWKWIMRRLGR